MRIISGVARGRRLKAPDTVATRPVTDRVREAVFSSIGALVEGASVADLYAGSGSFGLEALSRGAAGAVFVEKGRRALAALRDNIRMLGLGGTVVEGEVRTFLASTAHRFDLVFMDPPWGLGSELLGEDMGLLDRHLNRGAQVVISRRSGDPPPRHPETWGVAADKRYGDTRILRYEKLKATHDHRSMPGEL